MYWWLYIRKSTVTIVSSAQVPNMVCTSIDLQNGAAVNDLKFWISGAIAVMQGSSILNVT
jgi:O-glycosyl hydrolase